MIRKLPQVKYEGKLWYFDERLEQIRNVENHNDFMNLDDFGMEYFKNKEKINDKKTDNMKV